MVRNVDVKRFAIGAAVFFWLGSCCLSSQSAIDKSSLELLLCGKQHRTMEGLLGDKKVRINIVSDKGQLYFLAGEMKTYRLKSSLLTEDKDFKMTFYQSYPGSPGASKHIFVLEGTIGKDGTYAGAYREEPAHKQGEFSLAPAEPDRYSGSYHGQKGYLFVQLRARDKCSFVIGNDYCSVSGEGAIENRQARFEKLLSGMIVFVNLDFSEPEICQVTTNVDSKEAREQHITWEFCGLRGTPDFSGPYAKYPTSKRKAAVKTRRTSQDFDIEQYYHDEYCKGVDDEEKSKQLDLVKGRPYRAPDPDAAEFVFSQIDIDHSHGAPAGECGVRVDIFRDGPEGDRIITGSWEDLDAGYFPSRAKVSSRHCLFTVAKGGFEDGAFSCERTVIDVTGRVLGRESYCGSRRATWVRLDGKDHLWEMSWEGIALRTPDLKDVWSKQEKTSFLGSTLFSPSLRYAYRRLGKAGDRVAVHRADGKYEKRFKLPFKMGHGTGTEILGVNDVPELVLCNEYRIYKIDMHGSPSLAAILPTYKNRKAPDSCYFHGEASNPFREYEYEADTESIKDYPRPKIKLDINTLDAEESLDGETWHSIDIKAKQRVP